MRMFPSTRSGQAKGGPRRGRRKDYAPSRDHKHEHQAWVNMIHRCHNPDHADFKYYGARGIAVCDVRWATMKEQRANRRPMRPYQTAREGICRQCRKLLDAKQSRGLCDTCYTRSKRQVART